MVERARTDAAEIALPLMEDALSQSLRRLSMGPVSSIVSRLAPPWGVHFPTSSAVAGFHRVCEGRVWLAPDRGGGMWLEAGDLVLFPFGAGHVICDQPGSPAIPYHQVRAAAGPTTHELLCGAYKLGASRLDVSSDPVLAMLPDMVCVRAARVEATPGFATLLGNLREEVHATRPGRDAVIGSLVGATFIYLVRSWLASRDALASSPVAVAEAAEAAPESRWITAPRDPRLSRALAAIHVNPAERWSVEKLAEIAKMSRASFARRFAQLVGATPLAYVAARRLDLAARLLADSDQQLGEIAAAVGYESEFALSRAFKRSRNLPPGKYRALHRSGRRAAR
jgi:AraC-like DNA-binding protein